MIRCITDTDDIKIKSKLFGKGNKMPRTPVIPALIALVQIHSERTEGYFLNVQFDKERSMRWV